MLEVVTIDGPSASGKSTVSRLLASRLGFSYLDTGAMYRAFACAVLEAGAQDDASRRRGLLDRFDVTFRSDGDAACQRVLCCGSDVTDAIRDHDVGMWASTLSADPAVRERMTAIQRAMGGAGRIVAEGRDMGTVVFPDAFAKFFMAADIAVRARRRYDELRARGAVVSEQDVMRDMQARDEQDSTRAVAPLKAADDAVTIDTSRLAVDEVVDRMHSTVKERYRAWTSS